MLTIALISTSLLVSFVLGNCSIQPMYLDIHERNVGGGAFSYGTYINVGSPEQELSLWPSLELNETTVADESFCSTSICSVSSAHGLFHPGKSTSWRTSLPPQLDNTSMLTGSVSSIAETGTDFFYLLESFFEDDTPTETNLTSFPLELLSNYTSNQTPFFGPGGLLGLGSSSSLLDILVGTGKIASRSFGLYLGTAYPQAGGSINGSLTLGGYDAARLQEPIQSFPISASDSTGSPLKVQIPHITVTNATDANVAILSSDDSFDAYISTSQYEMTLPSSLSTTLAQALNATLNGNTLSMHSTVSATLTIFLANTTFNVTLAPTLLRTNAITFSNSGPFVLGSSFLSSTYLTVSYDTSTFYISPVVPNAQFVTPTTLCGSTILTPQGASHISFFVRNGLIGVIIGTVIGGLALCLLSFVILREWRQRSKSRRIVRFVDLKRQEGEDMELGSFNTHGFEMKAGQVRVVEKMEKERGQDSEALHFDPPPKRATVLVKKGTLKVKTPK